MGTLALIIGNSRLHWAWFHQKALKASWHTSHLSQSVVDHWIAADLDLMQLGAIGNRFEIPTLLNDLPLGLKNGVADRALPAKIPDQLVVASVVPAQTSLWLNFPRSRLLTLADIPLGNLYGNLGLDRALAALGSGETLGYPTLMVDSGTALTVTGLDSDRQLVGGAILPGVGLQLRSLTQQTAALPAIDPNNWLQPDGDLHLPQRWAQDTEAAIASGVLYTLVAGIQAFGQDWLQRYPHSTIALTGGDGALLWAVLKKLTPNMGDRIQLLPDAGFLGIAALLI